MKKAAKDLKTGDKVSVAGETLKVKSIEISDIGKQGTKKCRIEFTKENGESVVAIRPEDYPFTIL